MGLYQFLKRTAASVVVVDTDHLGLFTDVADDIVKTKTFGGILSPLGSPIATTAPPNVTAGSGGTIGVASRVAREDHTHGLTSTVVLSLLAAAAGSVSVNSQRITSLTDPSSPQDAATKAYVDGVASGLHIKSSAKAASTATLTLSGAQTIDGVSVGVGDRVLVKDQASGVQNGIYVAAAGAWARSADFAVGTGAASDFVFVEQGAANGNNGFVCTNDAGTDVVGTDALVFVQFSGAGQIMAGAGLSKAGNTLDVNVDNATLEINADTLRIKDLGVSYAKLPNVTAPAFLARSTVGSGSWEPLTDVQSTAILRVATTALKGLMSSADKVKADGGYKDVVADFGADPTGAADATSIIQTAVDSFTNGGRLYFPVGTYKISGTITISKAVIIVGAGRSISVVSTTHATADMFLMASGAQGAGFEQIRLIGATAGTRTGGFAVNFANLANVYMQQCDVLFCHSGIRSAGALQFLDDLNIREMGANAPNGQGVLIDSTGDRYLRRLTTDNGSNPTGFAAVRVRQCSSLVLTDCNLIHGSNALDLVANGGVGTAIASVWATRCFFDTGVIGCNVVPASGNDTVQRVSFVGCWFGTHSTAGVVLGHANVNSVDFVGCEFYQSPVGIDAQACTEWAVRGSRFAGNTTNAIRTTAGATHSFTITDNVIGNVAGFGANAQGINIQAGTYKRYQVSDNRGLESNTTPGLIDLGVVGATDQKLVGNNMGALFGGAMATLGAPITSVNTTEFAVLSCRIPANAVKIGDVFRVRILGISSSTGTLIFRVRVGANGTIADAQAWISTTSAGQVANARASFDALLTVRSIGAGGTVQCEGIGTAGAALLPTLIAAVGTAAAVTTAAWFVTATVTCSVGTFATQQATIEVV